MISKENLDILTTLDSEQKERVIVFFTGYIEGLFNSERANQALSDALDMVNEV